MRIADFGIWEFVVGLLILGTAHDLYRLVLKTAMPHIDDKADEMSGFWALFVIVAAIAIGGVTLAMLRYLL